MEINLSFLIAVVNRFASGSLVQGERGADAQREGADGAQGAVVAPHPGPARAGQPEGLWQLLLRRRKLARKLQVSCQTLAIYLILDDAEEEYGVCWFWNTSWPKLSCLL